MENLIELFSDLPKPFNKKGEPDKFLRLTIPFFNKEVNTKAEMLKMMGIDLHANPKKRNIHSHTLAKLSSKGVLDTKARGCGFWRRGKNWDLFLAWITIEMTKNPKLKNKFKDMLVQYETNALEFIMKDAS